MRERFLLRLDEVEIYTFQAIDGYLGDLVSLQTAQSLLFRCENDLNNQELMNRDAFLTGKILYLRATILLLEAYRLSSLPHFEEILPLLERARVLFAGNPEEEILTLHTLGRAYADLAFAENTSEERYRELMDRALRSFREALDLSSRQNNFMRTILMTQLGNTLNNIDKGVEALEILNSTLSYVDPNDEPNRFLAIHLDIAQVLTGKYLETLTEEDLNSAEKAADRALLISDSLRSSRIVPHVRFNLAMTLFTIAQEKHDPDRNNQAILEIEKVLSVWTFNRFLNLHLMATDTLCRFLDLQESLTREPRHIDRAISLVTDITSRLTTDESAVPAYRNILANLYGRLAELYFKRALHETGKKQSETYALSIAADRKARELRLPDSENITTP